MAIKKYAAKAGKYAGVALRVGARGARRRYLKKGKPRMIKMLSDIALLKSLVNVEKKRIDVSAITQPVSAFNGGGGVNGCLVLNITPIPLQGITGSTRNGNSVKLVSACIDMRFAQQSAAVNDIKLRYFIICRPDAAVQATTAQVRDRFLEVNPFGGTIDFWSNRDPEFYNAFRVLKTGVITLKQDQITSGQSLSQIKCPLKLNHHLKYNADASNVTTKNEFYLFVTASAGDQTLNTGATVDYNARWYFTDN